MQAGRKVLLKIGNGAMPVESFVTLGGVRLTQLDLEQSLYDTSHAGSGAWRTLLAGAGKRQVRLSAEGVFEDSASEETLRSMAFGGVGRTVEVHFGNGDRIAGLFVAERYVRRGEVGGLEGFAVTLHSAGAVSFVAG